MNWDNIPQELRDLPRWAVSRSAADKAPLDANRSATAPASSTDPNTWATFDQACTIAEDIGGLIGFMLSDNDPFTIIDLDNKPEKPAIPEDLERFNQLIDNCDSYAEMSASGSGAHIITKARLPEDGKRAGNLEVYWSRRYMICTGNVLRNFPIAEGEHIQSIVTGVYNWIVGQQHGSTMNLVQYVQPETDKYTDQEVYERIERADNFAKFKDLWEGNLETIQTNYPQFTGYSEATYAFIEMLRHYTDNNADQSFRIYLASPLSRRPSDPDPAKRQRNLTRKYFDRSWSKNYSRAVQQEEPTLDELKAMYGHLAQLPAAPVDEQQPEFESPEYEPFPISLPPGLVGDIARYFYATTIRPVPEVALCAAIAFMAGLAARAYNISGTGLNQYIILLAPTGTGKEGAKQGIDSLIAAMQQANPMINANTILGPGSFASGQALVRSLDDNPCFVSVVGEFGLRLQQMSEVNATSSQQMLRLVLLDLYNKSGFGQTLSSTAYSDKEKNTKTVNSPNVTILGESTQERFFEGLNSSHLDEGLIPRFTVVEYTGLRPDRNPNVGCLPPLELVQRVTSLFATCGQINAANQAVQVAYSQHDTAHLLLDTFDSEATAEINKSEAEVYRHVWNRAHLKALKLSALLAVGVNPYNPVITEDLAKWAIQFVKNDANLMLNRFKSGNVGSGDEKQYSELCRLVKMYFTLDVAQANKAKLDPRMIKSGIIPKRWLQQQTAPRAAFKNDRAGATMALKKNVDSAVENGLLAPVSKSDALKNYKSTANLFFVNKHLL